MEAQISRRVRPALAALIATALFAPAVGARAAALPVTDQTLSCGVRLLAQREPDTPLVAIDVFIMTAGAPEDASKPGLAGLVARTLFRGTSNQTEETIADKVGLLGGSATASWDRNFTQIKVLTQASQFSNAAYLISDILKNASVSNAAVGEAREEMLQELQQSSDDIYLQTYNQLRKKLYYGQRIATMPVGDPLVIADLTGSEARAFYRRYYTGDNIVVSVVGNVDPAQAATEFSNDLIDLTAHSPSRPASIIPPSAVPLSSVVTVKSYRGDLNGGYVMVGYLVPGAGEPEYPAILLLNALLGGMKTSLLFTNLREKQGLGYDTSSNYSEDVGLSDLTGYILSSGDPAAPASPLHGLRAAAHAESSEAGQGASFTLVREALVEQFKTLRSRPPSDAMLARAKRFVIGSYLQRHERLLDRAYWLGFSEMALTPLGGYRFDTGFSSAIDAVSADDVLKVAQKYLSGGYVVSMVLPGNPNAGEVSK